MGNETTAAPRSFRAASISNVVLAASILAAAILGTSGCDRDPLSGAGTTTPASPGPQLALKGAGSTFAFPIYTKWFEGYETVSPGVTFDYRPIGSSGGIRLALQGAVDFAGTDGPVSNQQLEVFKARYNCELLHLPMALGAVVPAYNLPGLNQDLNFTPEALAGMYLGKITHWNDPELLKANPGVALPESAIVVVHRSDGSGTSYCWTDFLSKVSSDWKQSVGVGTTVGWPAGRGAEGNAGVAETVRTTSNSIGYVELTYAIDKKLAYGAVKNPAGRFVKADPASVKAAAAAVGGNMPADFRVSIVDAPGDGAYPVASFTWILVPEKIEDPEKLKAVKEFLHWAVTSGQLELEPLHYAMLPDEIAEREKGVIDQIH